MTASTRALAATALGFAMTALANPLAGQVLALRFEPEAPLQGTLFRITIDSAQRDVVLASGSAAGEPLHFAGDDGGTLTALAAAPLDAGSAVSVSVVALRRNGATAILRREVPVRSGTYRLERLTVDPRFGAPPDSATAARMARERERALEVSRQAHRTPRLWERVILPRASRITSAFGSGREFNGAVQSRHTGTDFRGAPGDPVVAAARGIVALADTFLLAGRAIYLDHGAGLITAYFHLSEALVAEGDTVDMAQRLGRVGATGRVTGPHLHWVVQYGAISVDPMSLVSLADENRLPD